LFADLSLTAGGCGAQEVDDVVRDEQAVESDFLNLEWDGGLRGSLGLGGFLLRF
jgi:hypothetical protein